MEKSDDRILVTDARRAVEILGGRDVVGVLVQVHSTNVSHSLRRGQFSSKWYRLMQERAVALGYDLSMELFDFKEPSDNEGAEACQGE